MIRIFRVLVPASVFTLFVCEALLIFACYAAAAYVNPDLDGEVFLLYDRGLTRIAIVAAVILLGMYFYDQYRDVRIRSRALLLQQLSLVIGIAFIAQALISYWNEEWALPQRILILGSLFTLASIFAGRLLFSLAISNAVGVRQVLFLGMSPVVAQLARHLKEHPELGLAPIGYLDRDEVAQSVTAGVTRLGSIANLPGLVDEYHPEWIVVGRREEVQPQWVEEFLELRFGGVHAEEAASLYENTLGRVCAREIQPGEVIFSGALQPRAWSVNLQSMYSPAIALLLAPLLLPLGLLIALLVKLTSRGPVFLQERRVGLDGAQFTMYRFRCTPFSDRSRQSGLGRILRGLGLDALPQWWNVLRGEMSIVGPAPDRPEFAAILNELIPFYNQRTAVKPGMTGWTQLNDYGDGPVNDAIRRLEYDLYYVKNLSPSLDIFVMLSAIRQALVFRAPMSV